MEGERISNVGKERAHAFPEQKKHTIENSEVGEEIM
jgi:hypothetical protein